MANVEIRRIIGNKDTKIGELQWDSVDEWDSLEYFLDWSNDLLDPNNSGLYVYMMEKEDFGAEEYFDCGCVYEEMMEGAMCESCGHTTCIDCSENINTTDENYKNWKCYEGYGCNKDDSYEAEGINLRKRIEDLIDLREVNFTGFKKDTKREAANRARRIENELKGVLPKSKSYKVDKPKWFKMAQTGIVLGVAGLIGYSGFKGKE